MATKIFRQKFFLLQPGIRHHFQVRALTLGCSGPWSDTFNIMTSRDKPIEWPAGSDINAVPNLFLRHIWVSWTPVLDFSIKTYRLFRNRTNIEPNSKEKTHPDWLIDTGFIPFYVNNLHTSSEPANSKQGNGDWIGIETETTYYYWVCCVDNGDVAGELLEPDNAELGAPAKPEIQSCTTNLSTVLPGICDVTVNWECVGGAEYYYAQSSFDNVIWSLPVRIEHDPATGDNQSATFLGFFTNTGYYFRVQAINVEWFLFSELSDVFYYKTDHDIIPPEEVSGVDADLTVKTAMVRVKWDSILDLLQEVVKYRIYRKVTTSSTPPSAPAKGTWWNGSEGIVKEQNASFFGLFDEFWDNVKNYKNKYIWYWVSAVDKYHGEDSYNGEGNLGGPDSVSFTRPSMVTSGVVTANTLFNFLNMVVLNRVVLSDWTNVLEADYYKIRWRFQPKDANGNFILPHPYWGPWTGISTVDELSPRSSHADVFGQGYIQFGIKACNDAGDSNEKHFYKTVGADKNPPSQISGTISTWKFGGSQFFGVWAINVMQWNTHSEDEGVKSYIIRRQLGQHGTVGYYTQVAPAAFGMQSGFVDFLPTLHDPSITYIQYHISAVDVVGNEGPARRVSFTRPA